MNVRGYRAIDLEACRTLWVQLTEWHRDLYGAPEIGGDDPGAHFDQHLAAVGATNIWVAECDDDVVGLVGMIPDGTQAELEPIVVSPPYRGRGIGRALVDVVIATARERGLRTVFARPAARNAETLRFFHSRGFDVLGQVEVMYDLVSREHWRSGEQMARREFRV
ncbi:MAG: GNAT family N-acetyltransferase [Thermoleophilia bacterium]|nr:GNAT family N-acetyltransferase [Thermoleophilia bacterium]MDH4339523.1 GNAT family N-acetyltransferase [Thermoleophilia bacterium]MDH5281101.1 GNAT family N-acetyltransferase [Thermoleophilia bacterium]